MSFIKNKTFLVIIGGIIIGVAAWYTLTGKSDPTSLVEQTTVAEGVATPEERAILDVLLQLRAIQLAGTIFTDPAFAALRDFRTEIVAEPIGRRNPFAPITPIAPPPEATKTTTKK